MTVAIRTADASDADAIASVHVRSWRFAYRDFLPADYLDGLDASRHAEEHWRPILTSGRPGCATWLALVDGEPAGIASVEGHEGVRPPEEPLPACGYVHHIHVAPEFRGTGVGSMLWRTALDALLADGWAEGILAVYEPNAAARAFYEAHGWQADGWSFFRTFPAPSGDVTLRTLRYRGPLAVAAL